MKLPASSVLVAQQSAPTPTADKMEPSPADRMARRWPQKVRVGDLIGLPVLDDNDVTLGFVREVVRGGDGGIKLIVSYSRWFGRFGRPVAVPIEVLAIFGRQIASLDMKPDAYRSAPPYVAGSDADIPADETIRIAVMRR